MSSDFSIVAYKNYYWIGDLYTVAYFNRSGIPIQFDYYSPNNTIKRVRYYTLTDYVIEYIVQVEGGGGDARSTIPEIQPDGTIQ
jgi:hypothetical protein